MFVKNKNSIDVPVKKQRNNVKKTKSARLGLIAFVLVILVAFSFLPKVGINKKVTPTFEPKHMGISEQGIDNQGSAKGMSNLNIYEHPKSQEVNIDDNLRISVKTNNPSGVLTYTWFRSDTDTVDTVKGTVVGNNSSSYSVPTKQAGTFYFFVEINLLPANGSGVPHYETVASDVATIKIKQGPADKPEISKQIESAKVNQGDEHELYVIATANGTLSYEWYVNSRETTEGKDQLIQDQTDSKIDIDTSVIGDFYYYVIVTNTVVEDGQIFKAFTKSTIAKLEIDEFEDFPEIIKGPESQTIEIGDWHIIRVQAEGTGVLSYQWFVNDNFSIYGATLVQEGPDEGLMVDSTVENQYFYFVVVINRVTDSYGEKQEYKATSKIAIITVIESIYKPVIKTEPKSQVVKPGEKVVISVEIEPVAGKVEYQWYQNTVNSNKDGISLGERETTDTLEVTRVETGFTYYYVEIANNVDGKIYTTVSKVAVIEVSDDDTDDNGDKEDSTQVGDGADRLGGSQGGLLGSRNASTIVLVVLSGFAAILLLGAFVALPVLKAKKAKSQNRRYR